MIEPFKLTSLSCVLSSNNAFMIATHEDLRRKINELKKRYDAKFHAVFATLRQMLDTPIPLKQQTGLHASSQSLRSRKPSPSSRVNN